MNGIRLRLVAAIGLIVVAALAVTFIVVYGQTGSQLRGQLDTTLRDSVAQMSSVVRQEGNDNVESALTAVRQFSRGQPYVGTSVLHFAIAPGHGTATTHPELFGDSSDDTDESPAQRRQEQADGRRLAHVRVGFADQVAPDTGVMRTYEQPMALADGAVIYLGAGLPTIGVARAQEGVRESFLLAGLVGVALALIGAFIAGGRIAAPLRGVASTAARIDGGDLSPRMTVHNAASSEVRVLASAFNHMLDRLAGAFERQREFVADASHELRTPLTVARGQLELLADPESVNPEEVARVREILSRETARMTRLTDDLLLLAQSDESSFVKPEQISIPQFVTELWDGLSLTADRRFEVGELPDVQLRADPDRLAQALRNLGRNAIQHTRERTGLVRIDVELLAARIEQLGSTAGSAQAGQDARTMMRFKVSDDGPGIPVAQRAAIFERFYRTDPARSGSGGAGLGLAIVKVIAEAHGGAVSAAAREGGGAVVQVDLPLSPQGRDGSPVAK